jgi:hypothetical protein
MGETKWARLQRDSPILVAEPPPDEFVNDRKTQLEAKGFPVIIH